MRCLRFAGLRRLGTIVLSTAAVSAVPIANPAAARPHRHIRDLHHAHYLHRAHFGQQRRLASRTAYAASYPTGFAPFAAVHYRHSRARFTAGGWTQTNWAQSPPQQKWSQNTWHQNAWHQNTWGENNWHQTVWRDTQWSGNSAFGGTSAVGGMAAAQASAAGIPVSLVERVIKRESGGNPRAVSRGNYGLMQIRLGTARAMGYTGSAAGLLDAQTNMTYAVRYLAGAYRAAGGNESRAVALYASGYYAIAKRQGFSPYGAPSTMVANTFSAPSFAAYQPFQAEDQFARPVRYRRWHYRRHPV